MEQSGQELTKEQIEARQRETDEIRRMIELSNDFENQLKKEINESMPFISDLTDLAVLKEEYAQNKFEDCFDALYGRYKRVRRLRRDGNCFYRAFLFQVFEHFILTDDKTQYAKFVQVVEASEKDLMDNCGYDEIAIDDFYQEFVTALKKLADVPKADATKHLMELLCNHEAANYIIMYARFMTACYLKTNAIIFEGFVGDVAAFCQSEVEQLDVEADHPQIMGIVSYF